MSWTDLLLVHAQVDQGIARWQGGQHQLVRVSSTSFSDFPAPTLPRKRPTEASLRLLFAVTALIPPQRVGCEREVMDLQNARLPFPKSLQSCGQD